MPSFLVLLVASPSHRSLFSVICLLCIVKTRCQNKCLTIFQRPSDRLNCLLLSQSVSLTLLSVCPSLSVVCSDVSRLHRSCCCCCSCRWQLTVVNLAIIIIVIGLVIISIIIIIDGINKRCAWLFAHEQKGFVSCLLSHYLSPSLPFSVSLSWFVSPAMINGTRQWIILFIQITLLADSVAF